MNRPSIRFGFSSASRRPWLGSRSSDSATVPNCRSRSTSATRRRRSWAISQATLVATVVAPTPPRVPVTATSLPSLLLLRMTPVWSVAARIAFCSRIGVIGLTR